MHQEELGYPPPTPDIARPQLALRELMHTTVIVSALGYFVDIYDLVVFGIVRKPSLESLGLADAQILSSGLQLINMQMVGMLLGGILWGILGDKRGRVSVLFGSILLYSLANLLNAHVTTLSQYALLRFLAGVGLAGELGAAITLVSETLSHEQRGYATAFIAGFGVSGAIAAGLVAQYFDWKQAYTVGGILGLALLGLRMGIYESPMFRKMNQQETRRGHFFSLFTNRERFRRYIASILIGVPIWFVSGILVTFAPELTHELGTTGSVSAASAIMFYYGGLVIGDLASGFLSQRLRSRRKIIFAFLTALTFFMLVYLFSVQKTASYYYSLCFILGVCAGYWAVFATVAAEQFGTNLRATVATTAPNFVRGFLVPMTLAVQALQQPFGLRYAALIVGTLVIIMAAGALWVLQETYGKDLNYVEHEA